MESRRDLTVHLSEQELATVIGLVRAAINYNEKDLRRKEKKGENDSNSLAKIRKRRAILRQLEKSHAETFGANHES